MQSPIIITDQLLEGIRKGDANTINTIYKDYHQAIVHLVETNYGTKEDAHDVFQEGLVVIFQKAQNPDFKIRNSFLTYFYTVCRNIWYSKLRKRPNAEVKLDETVQSKLFDDAEPILEYGEQYFLYRKMFLRLGQVCQKVLQLFLQKVSMENIMQQMGYSSISYTKKRKYNCKEKLVALIKNDRSYQELRLG